MIKYLILLLLISQTSAYDLTGDNLIIPRYYEGNLLIFNDGSVSYSVFSNNTNEYLGTINPDQGIYVNESLNYKLYASYDEIQDFTDVEKVKEKFNLWWVYIFIGVILFGTIIFGIKRMLRI